MRKALVFSLLALVAFCAHAQDRLHMKSGSTYECEIIEYANGVFLVRMPDGSRQKASAARIAAIKFDRGSEDFEPAPSDWSPEPGASDDKDEDKSESEVSGGDVLELSPHWDKRLRKGSLAVRDAAKLLAYCAKAEIDEDGHPDIIIWEDIPYLAPLEDVKEQLGLGLASRRAVNSPIFPPDSFFCYSFDGNFEEGFDELLIVCDKADQVVAIQLVDDSPPSEMWFDWRDNYSEDWSVYNFVNDRKKGNPNWQVGFYVCQGKNKIFGYPPRDMPMHAADAARANPKVIRIDSELCSRRKNHYEMKSRERVRLFLPQPIANIMMYVARHAN